MARERANALRVLDSSVGTRPPVLVAANLSVGYGRMPVVRDVSLTVGAGEVVALLGSNGAGKTTTMLGLTGQLPLAAGSVEWLGRTDAAPLHRRCRHGMAFVPETRSAIFALSVRDNLRLGGGDLATAIRLFPELEALMNRRAGLLSGGEQQILALARVLSRRPRLLLLDELSLGLAPRVTARLLAAVRSAADDGAGVLLVEQHVRSALAIADRAYVLRRGQLVLDGRSDDLLDRISEIEEMYLTSSPHTDG